MFVYLFVYVDVTGDRARTPLPPAGAEGARDTC